ncbi:MAG: tRNA uridine-5-carboxymethylaminomethyl(34) synthesis enzyme MnmG, partial [Syntrophomonas sp.]
LHDRISLWELLRRPEIKISDFIERGWMKSGDSEILGQLEIQSKYEGYINKQREQVQRFERMENKKIPADINYDEVYSLSNEAIQKLKEIRPQSLGQASRIGGVSPADINILWIYLVKRRN